LIDKQSNIIALFEKEEDIFIDIQTARRLIKYFLCLNCITAKNYQEPVSNLRLGNGPNLSLNRHKRQFGFGFG
jgi:hypothetical protein